MCFKNECENPFIVIKISIILIIWKTVFLKTPFKRSDQCPQACLSLLIIVQENSGFLYTLNSQKLAH